jgi:quercetin dioxygenase-like cupin family protein
MRLFTMRRGGCSPYHQHDWEHEVFVLKGRGVLRTEGGETPLSARTAVFVPPMEWHQFSNAGRGTLEFLCLIPIKD